MYSLKTLSYRLALFITFTTGLCFPQSDTGTIVGIVRDASGGVVPQAAAAVTNVSTGAVWRGFTNDEGFYRIANLPPSTYEVEIEAKGFRRSIGPPARVSAGEVLRVDVAVEVGPVTEVVNVDAPAIAVNTEDPQLGKVVRDPAGLPVLSGANGRNALWLAATQPGVVFAGQLASQDGGRFSANGQRAQSNNYMLDGADANDLAANTPDSVQSISPNALEEFRIITGAMKAEYGRNTGAVVQVVTRSGANTFHGGASEYFRNTKLNAAPFFQKAVPGGTKDRFANGFPRKPQWNSNDFDANLGGPVVREKTFFFASYLGFRRRQGVSRSATVPNDEQRALIESQGTAEAKALLALVPRASTGNTLFSSPSNARTRDQGMAKLDHYFSPANRLAVTYFIDSMSLDSAPFAFGGSNVPGFGADTTQRFQHVILRDTHTFSPSLLNEFRASYHRNASVGNVPQNRTTMDSLGLHGIVPDDRDGEGPPWVIITGFSEFGNTIQGPQGRADNTFQYIDNVSWTRGRHYAKFGGEFRTYAQNQIFTFVNNGYIYIDGSGTSLEMVPQIHGLSAPLNDFANGFATAYIQNSAGRPGLRTRSVNLFFQDDWKLRSYFTLNAGLRWEYNSSLKELQDKVAGFRAGVKSSIYPDAPAGMVFPGDAGISRSTYDEDLNNFGPRVGFAWDVLKNGRLSLRGGYGLFYDVSITELTLPFITTPPYAIQPSVAFVDYADPWASSRVQPIAQPFPFRPVGAGESFNFSSIAPISLTVMDPHFATPYAQHWSLQVQYQAAKDWLVDVGYAGSNGVKLLNRRDINPGVPRPGASAGNLDLRRVYNTSHPEKVEFGGMPFADITNQNTDANSNYSSFQAGVTKRFVGGFAMTHAYTWAHSIDNKSGLRGSLARSDSAAADRGNSEMDVRHRYVATYEYEFPWMAAQSGMLGRIAGGWGVSGVTTFQTGLAFDITEATDRCLCGSGGQRPDYIAGTVTFYDPRSVSAVPGRANSWFDGTGGGTATAATNPFFRRVGSAATYAAGAGRFGNFGRNVLHGPGINNWDFAAFKRVRIREGHQVNFRAEFFNLFNHAQFEIPNGSIASVNFGRVTTTREPRIVQFALRYSF
ncbi:MAG TPA: TonB-dependent receptor [Bryobacteraceae bacterium]|nr:TonB-dependent receptor [Bryobacteraceae bacterium]